MKIEEIHEEIEKSFKDYHLVVGRLQRRSIDPVAFFLFQIYKKINSTKQSSETVKEKPND